MTSKYLMVALTMTGAMALVGCNKEGEDESASTAADKTSNIEEHASKTLDDVKAEGEQVVKGAEEAMDDAKQHAEKVVDDVKQQAEDVVKDVKEKVSEKAAAVSAEAKEAMDVYLTKLAGATDVLEGVKSQFGAVSALPKLTGLAGDIKKQWGTLNGLSPDSMGQLTDLFGGRMNDVVSGFKTQVERMKGSGDFGAISQLLEKIPLPSSEPSK